MARRRAKRNYKLFCFVYIVFLGARWNRPGEQMFVNDGIN